MPGEVIQELMQVEMKNPLVLTDEVDKKNWVGDYWRSLNIVDPEQNNGFFFWNASE